MHAGLFEWLVPLGGFLAAMATGSVVRLSVDATRELRSRRRARAELTRALSNADEALQRVATVVELRRR